MVPSTASAHTVQLCVVDSGPVTTFYAGTYHDPSESSRVFRRANSLRGLAYGKTAEVFT